MHVEFSLSAPGCNGEIRYIFPVRLYLRLPHFDPFCCRLSISVFIQDIWWHFCCWLGGGEVGITPNCFPSKCSLNFSRLLLSLVSGDRLARGGGGWNSGYSKCSKSVNEYYNTVLNFRLSFWERPSSYALYPYSKEKETHEAIMGSGIARRCPNEGDDGGVVQ